jgi:hypothetical protein
MRIILVGASPLLCDIVKAVVEDEPQLEIVGEFASESTLIGASVVADVDCAVAVIDGSTDELTRRYAPVIGQHPRMRVVGVVEGGRACVVYELAPRCSAVGELSPDILVRTISGGQPDSPRRPDGLR